MNDVFYRSGRRAQIQRTLISTWHSVHFDLNNDYTKSVFICGTTRSGTTWLAELLNYRNTYRYMYEPFSMNHVALCKHFSRRQYLRPNDKATQYLGPARDVFTGRIRDGWIDHLNKRYFVQRRLVKDVRSNLMLKWIRNNFPGMPIVLILRHPCAIAVSKARLRWRLKPSVFLEQSDLVSDYLMPFVTEIAHADTFFKQAIVAWCVETLVPLSQLEDGDVHLIFYENLCANPDEELQKLFIYLKQPFDRRVLSYITRPSLTSRLDGMSSTTNTMSEFFNAWRREMSPKRVATASRITKLFGLDKLYPDLDGILPNAEWAQSLLRRRAVIARPEVVATPP